MRRGLGKSPPLFVPSSPSPILSKFRLRPEPIPVTNPIAGIHAQQLRFYRSRYETGRAELIAP